MYVVVHHDNDNLIAVKRTNTPDGIGYHAINTIFVAAHPGNAPDAEKDAPFNTVPYTVTKKKIQEYQLTLPTTVKIHFNSNGECLDSQVRTFGIQSHRTHLRNALDLLRHEGMIEDWDHALIQSTWYNAFNLPGLKVIDTGFGVTHDDEAFAGTPNPDTGGSAGAPAPAGSAANPIVLSGFAVRSFLNEARARPVKRARRRATRLASVKRQPLTVALK